MVKNIAIVSLSSGVLGEGFVAHEVEIGLKRLRNYGLNVRFMPHALKGLAYVKNHPEDRAADLLAAVVAILFLRSERRVFYPSSGRRV